MIRFLVVLVLLLVVPASPASSGQCVGLRPPVDGAVTADFEPEGVYGGHWGVDFGIPVGALVRAAGPGRVSFAGVVVDNMAVTVDHGGGLVSTVSYLEGISTARSATVAAGSVLGTSGLGHGGEFLHFSVRLDGAYVDPEPLLGCRPVVPGDALRLVG